MNIIEARQQRLASIAAEEVARRNEVSVIDTLIAALPPEIANGRGRVHPHTPWAKGTVVIEGHTASCIPKLIALLPPVLLQEVSEGCLSFQPMQRISDKVRERAKIRDIAPVFLEYTRTLQQSKTTSTVEWYWQATPDVLAHIEVVIPPVGEIVGAHKFGAYNRFDERAVLEYNWVLNEAARTFIARTKGHPYKFASGGGEYPNKYVVVWQYGRTAQDVFGPTE